MIPGAGLGGHVPRQLAAWPKPRVVGELGIFAAEKKPIKDGLKPSDVVTKEFIDQGIGVK